MKLVAYRDPVFFHAAVEDYLLEDDVRHSLILGILSTLIDRPDVYSGYHLWLVEDEGRPVCAALRTPPHNVVISAPRADGAIEALADGLIAEGTEVPGVVASLPEADTFTQHYLGATGGRTGVRMGQAIHVAERVDPVPTPSGEPRLARPTDLELLAGWYRAFHEEAIPREPWDEGRVRRRLVSRLAGEPGGAQWLWEDEKPVSLVGCIGDPPGSVRIGPVYTPEDLRGRGYATALTAHVTGGLLDRGARYCLLYTDLANPTSNAIYHRIGYRVVCEAAMIAYEASP